LLNKSRSPPVEYLYGLKVFDKTTLRPIVIVKPENANRGKAQCS
jgi:hypothetical protein